MALQKSKSLLDGTSGDYWHITEFNINIKTMKCTVSMGLWIDHAHYVANAFPLNYPKRVSFIFAPTDFASGITPSYVYTQILNYANTMITPLGGGSPVVRDADLSSASVVA